MEILEYFDEYKEPWKILARDIDEDLAKAYIDKLCYDKDSPLLNGANRTDVLNSIVAAIGIGRMKTFIHTLASYMQMRHLAVDAALSRVECEKFYIENKDGSRKRSNRRHTGVDDRMDGVFAALKADTTNSLDFSLLNKMNPEEKTYRIRCIALKLFCTLWMKCYTTNQTEAAKILPLTHIVYTARKSNGTLVNFQPALMFDTLIKSSDKTAAAQGFDETSLKYFLTADVIDRGLYSKATLVETVWNNIDASHTAHEYLEAICGHISDLISPVTVETDADLVKCYQDYDTLMTLHEIAHFVSINECRSALNSDTVKRDRARQDELTAVINSIDEIDTTSQQLNMQDFSINSEPVTTATVVCDGSFSFTLDELQDRLVDQVALIPTLIDKGDNTFAVCECEYEGFLTDPDNPAYWQPADDLLYFKYIKQQARNIQPQKYDIARYLVEPDQKVGDSYLENLGASLIKPYLYCHKCGRLMLPTANFLSKLSIAARNDQISTGGQLSSAPLKNSDGYVLNHTANAIGQKMNDLDKNNFNRDVSRIAWPEVTAIGSKHNIEITNVFIQPAYADYFMQISKAVTMTQANQAAAKLESDIAKIVEAGRKASLGYSKLDYLYTLVTLCDNASINMKILALQSRVYFGAETMLAYIRQAKAAINSGLYDTNVYDKIDMPFGYSNIKPLLDSIIAPADCITKLGFSSLDELISSVVISGNNYAIDNETAITDALMPVAITVPVEPSITREQFEAMKDTSGIETKLVYEIPGRSALISVLNSLEKFYVGLSGMAHQERLYLFNCIANAQSSVGTIALLSSTTDVDNMLSAAELSLLNRSAADVEFWELIDTDLYRGIIADMAENLPYCEISSKSAVVSRAVVDSLVSNSKNAMTFDLHAEAVGKIVIDSAADLPALSCLHQRFTGNAADTYEHMVATYMSACGLLEDTGAFLADEAADFAIKIYYECVVDDTISSVLKKNIANNVTTESYYCTGGIEQ